MSQPSGKRKPTEKLFVGDTVMLVFRLPSFPFLSFFVSLCLLFFVLRVSPSQIPPHLVNTP